MNDFQCECPFCGGLAECETTHNGVGLQQTQPYICNDCGSTQMNPWGEETNATEEEKRFGWWRHPDFDDKALDFLNTFRANLKEAQRKQQMKENSRLMRVE